MPLTANSAFRLFFRGAGKTLLLVAGLAFFFGGRAIHEFFGVNRAVAEVEGMAIAVLSGALGIGANALAENFFDYENQ